MIRKKGEQKEWRLLDTHPFFHTQRLWKQNIHY